MLFSCVSECFVPLVPPQAGDVITEVESVDEQWIVGFAGGRRGIVPKSFVSIP